MNLSEMSTFVRDHAQTDTEDAPDSTLTVYAGAAYRDIQRRVHPWPDKLDTYTFTTVAGQSTYLFNTFTSTDLEFITSVVGPDRVLSYASHEQMRELNTPSITSGANPSLYAVSKTSITLWPVPSGAVTITVTGYRTFTEWPVGSTEPDLDRGFDIPICWYMLSKYYLGQEDLEMAAKFQGDYESDLATQIAAAMRTSTVTAGPRIFGGEPGLFNLSYEQWMRRNTEG